MLRSVIPLQLILLTNLTLALDYKIPFMLDFLKAQSKPTHPVILQNCFTINEKVELVKNSFNPTTFYRQDSLNRSDFGVNPHYYLFILDLTCTQSPERIIQKIDTKLYQHPFRWIIFTGKHAIDDDDKILNNIRALVDSDILIPQIIGKGSSNSSNDDDDDDGEYNLRLKQFYKIEDNSDKIYYEHYGMWRKKTGLVVERDSAVIASRRSNLHGKLITTSYVHLNRSSREHLTDFVDKNIDSIMKVNYFLVNAVLDTLNVTRKELFQMTWGYYNIRTKKWSGMVGDLVHKGVDIGGTPLFIQVDRLPYLDYTPLMTRTQGSFVFRAPQLSSVHNIYTLPFKPMVWFCCLILVILSTILLHVTSLIDHMGKSKEINQHKRITDSALSTVAVVCQMDSSMRSSVTSSRIILFFIFLTFSFLYAAYTANIVSLLQSPSKKIKTLQDLYDSKIELGVEDTPYMRVYVPNSEPPLHKKVYSNKLSTPYAGRKDHFMPGKEGIARIRKGLFAFIMEESPMYKLIEDTFLEHEKCELVNVEYVKFADPFLAIQKHSPYKEILRVKIVKILEKGIHRRFMRQFYTKKPVCVNRLNFQSIGISDSQSAIMLLPYGIAFAFVVLMLEKIFFLKSYTNKICLKI